MVGLPKRRRFAALVFAAVLTLGLFLPLGARVALATVVPWNSKVTVLAEGKNEDNPKSEGGQYIDVSMTFAEGAPQVSAADATTYLQNNVTIAGRSLNSPTYTRDITNVNVSGNVITFRIGKNRTSPNGKTANYNGKLFIAANGAFAGKMGDAPVETLIGTGVAIDNPDGTLNTDGSKTLTITHAPNNRAMVHVLIKDGESALFEGTGTFSNGGLTVHAHTFDSQTPADFAQLICNAVPEGSVDYTFTSGTDGSFTVSHDGQSCTNVKAYIYDGAFLNGIHGSVGDITEPEMPN